jgi:methylenetetrahydrofolate reductase (NADPH)
MTKIIDKIRKAEAQHRCCWSFEYFPPKTAQGLQNLYDRLERMYALAPEFIDVTWGAGGSTADLTLEICDVAQSVYGLETCMHLTCTNLSKSKLTQALNQAKEVGIQNILALRGDPPRDQAEWTPCAEGFAHAVDLVRFIRQEYGSWFGIAVAGYSEGHIESDNFELDMQYLKEKVDAGADYIITQMFYDVESFLDWVAQCRHYGITCPILPGIMPIQTYGGFQRMTTMSCTKVPKSVYAALEPIKDDDQKVKEYGIQLAIEMCQTLKDNGITNFHFYTMNLERSVRLILEGLEFVPSVESSRPLPWSPVRWTMFPARPFGEPWHQHGEDTNRSFSPVVEHSSNQRERASHLLEKPGSELHPAH